MLDVLLEIRPAASNEFPAVADLCVAAHAPFVSGDHHDVDVLPRCRLARQARGPSRRSADAATGRRR